jgi:hypothetical protein
MFKYIFKRYYKFLLPDIKICELQFWFVIHKPIMILVPIISFIGLLIILADMNWKWIDLSSPIQFSHSIIGLVALILSFVQVNFYTKKYNTLNILIKINIAI